MHKESIIASVPTPQVKSLFRDALVLLKPRITGLAVITAAVGMYLSPDPVPFQRVLVTLVAIALLVAGAGVLNMFLERDTDGLMERTRGRPIPQGRLSPDFGLTLGSLLIGFAIPMLFLFVNPLTGWLGVFSLISYVGVYTYLKRVSWISLLVGAIPGAAPPLLGWTAATGSIGNPGLLLFLVIYFWQIPHFLAIGLFHHKDYERAGLKVFPLHQSLATIRWQMILTTLPLLPITYALYRLESAGIYFLVIGLGLGLVFLASIFQGWWATDKEKWGRHVFRVSLLYLTCLFILIMANPGAKG